jgi:hypothetical protein
MHGSVCRAMDVGVLLGLTGLDVLDRDAPFLSPYQQLATDVFRAVVDPYGAGLSTPFEPPRVCRRVVCSTTKRPYRMSSGLHRTPPLLLRAGCIRWGQEVGGCYTNRPVSR